MFIATLNDLKDFPQWVCADGDKVPYHPDGYKAKADDPATWSAFTSVLRAQRNNPEQYIGIGYELVKEQSITVVDLDHCIIDGQLTEFAKGIVTRLNSYTEYSTRGSGLHIYCRGNIPKNIGDVAKGEESTIRIEMYDCKRYIIITGKHFPGTPETFEDRQEVLLAIHTEVVAQREAAKTQKPTGASLPILATYSIGDTPYGLRALTDECEILATWPDGDRNHQLNRSAFAIGQLIAGNELTEHTGVQALTDAAARAGLDEAEIKKTMRSGLSSGKQSPRSAPKTQARTSGEGAIETPISASYPCTDLGNAERFASRYSKKARWCNDWNCWMIFNGKCWEKDRSGRIDQFAKMTVRAIYKEVAEESDDQARAKLAKHAANSESNRSIRAMLDRAKSELPVVTEIFNTHLHLLNCKNGTLDLRTGELRPHNPEDLLTRCLAIDYNPAAAAPLWLDFVASIFANDEALIDFVQMSLGMSLSGDIREQCWFLCHGAGSNGKTTLTETVRVMLAEYGLAANIESFQTQKNRSINDDQANFYGKRYITASENQVGSRLNEAFIKKITGNEPLLARRLRENEFSFMPECTIWLSVNHKPVVMDTSKGMWRRVHYIPFTVTIEDNEIDKDLPKKLLAESEGILAWLVAGCLAWYHQGRLIIPETVKNATQTYREEMDFIALFLDAKCIDAPDLSVKAGELYEAYKKWCTDGGEKYETNTSFGLRMSERGYKKIKTRKGIMYLNIMLLPDEDPENDDESVKGVKGVHSCEHFSDISREEKIQGDLPPKRVHNPSQWLNPSHSQENEPTTTDQIHRELVESFLKKVLAGKKDSEDMSWTVNGIYPKGVITVKEFKRRVSVATNAGGDELCRVKDMLRNMSASVREEFDV
jgi:putative DNA primase/helicase